MTDRNPHTAGPEGRQKRLPWQVADMISTTCARFICGDAQRTFGDVGIDSRTLVPDSFFIAIKGQAFDGHDFAAQAVEKGAKGVMIQNTKAKSLPLAEWQKQGITCLAVSDTIQALGALAAFNRQRCNISVVGITGSNGKTTTRVLTSAVVSQGFEALSTFGNFNNEIGLPLTLLELSPAHKWAVLELGMSAPGEIGRLARICSPDVGLITNIGAVHLEGVGSIQGVLNAKTELFENMPPEKTVVLNTDDDHLRALSKRVTQKVLRFGLNSDAHIRAENIVAAPERTDFDLLQEKEKIPITLHTPGRFMVLNALAAAAVGFQLGLSVVQVKAGLESAKPIRGRMNLIKTALGVNIIDDTYNANPQAMAAALKMLSVSSETGQRVFVAGDMLELGQAARVLHTELGNLAARSKIARLYVAGDFAKIVADGARAQGMQAGRIFIGSKEEILTDLIVRLRAGDRVLVKGSRGMRMETIVRGLKEKLDT